MKLVTPVYQLAALGPSPFDIEFIKARLQIETEDLDEEAAAVIDADVQTARDEAVDFVERQTNLDLRAKTWRLEFPCWPAFPLTIQKGPVRSVEEVAYTAPDGTPGVFDAESWGWQRRGDQAAVYLFDCPTLPDLRRRPDAVALEILTGYYADDELTESPAIVPAPPLIMPDTLRKAVTLIAGHFYEHRDAVQEERTHEVESGIDALLASARLFL